jgi:hypothetical protein
MVTQFHTLLHFVTLFRTFWYLSAALAASTSTPANSKSHFSAFTVHFRTYSHITQAIAAGPVCHFHFRPPVYGSSRSVNNQFHTVYMIFLYGPCC